MEKRLATGAWRDFHENKIAHLPYVDPSTELLTEYARTLRHLQASGARWRRAEKNRAQPYALGTQGVGGSAGGHRPFGGTPPAPVPAPAPAAARSLGCGRAAGMPLRPTSYVVALLTARATATHR
jgi:hypothetical protein